MNKIIFSALSCLFAYVAFAEKSAAVPAAREPASVTAPTFTFKHEEVEGGRVVCGYASIDPSLQTTSKSSGSVSVSCVFVPSSK